MTAYRKKHSCETALISWVEDWRLALDNKQKALLLSMDMSKAFDLNLPSLTVAKLGAYGFNDKSLQLLRSYFKDRLNRVKVGKATSDWNVMKHAWMPSRILLWSKTVELVPKRSIVSHK